MYGVNGRRSFVCLECDVLLCDRAELLYCLETQKCLKREVKTLQHHSHALSHN